jgi:hypothetical protein
MAERQTTENLDDVFFTTAFSRKYSTFPTTTRLRQISQNDVSFTTRRFKYVVDFFNPWCSSSLRRVVNRVAPWSLLATAFRTMGFRFNKRGTQRRQPD